MLRIQKVSILIQKSTTSHHAPSSLSSDEVLIPPIRP
jgi:hypothetical protein